MELFGGVLIIFFFYFKENYLIMIISDKNENINAMLWFICYFFFHQNSYFQILNFLFFIEL